MQDAATTDNYITMNDRSQCVSTTLENLMTTILTVGWLLPCHHAPGLSPEG